MEAKKPQEPSKITRRELLKGAGALLAGSLLPACAKSADNPNSSSSQEKLSSQEEQLVKDCIRDGLALREAETINLEIPPNIDLKYEESKQVSKIRALNNTLLKILWTIGYLDVENSPRYKHVWSCNTYAIDFLRLVLGNQIIGGAYDKTTGIPLIYNPENPPPENSFEFFSSNNFDLWLQQYGSQYGWQMVTTQEELKKFLQNGAIAFAVTPLEDLKTQGGTIETGHALIVFALGNHLCISQATYDIPFQCMPPNHPKVNPEAAETNPETGEIKRYHFWIHSVP